jgi:hypothetical protein
MVDRSSDRRVWSTTARQLSNFVGDLQNAGVYSMSVRSLQHTFKAHGIYPATDFPDRVIAEPPDAFFTYHSASNFIDIQEIVWQTFDFAAGELRRRRPDLANVDLEPMISDGIRLWVDFLFIDQSARDLRDELDALPGLLSGARAHFVLGAVPLTRAWCTYEIALFNRRCAADDAPPLTSFIAPSRSLYHGWEHAETSEPEDKEFIAERIAADFPGGFDGFNHIMNQANATAVLSLTEPSVFYTPAALDALGKAAEAWYARTFPGASAG